MKKFLSVCKKQSLSPPPVWMMRQAGRYLPEYREVREKAGSFLNLVYDPILAAEVTLQPIRRFGFDAAILFSDILVIPQAIGSELCFEQGEGPKLTPIQTKEELKKIKLDGLHQHLAPIYETIRQTNARLTKEGFNQTTLIGFAGAPFTLACYMVQGTGKDHDFEIVRQIAYKNHDFFSDLIHLLTQSTLDYLRHQILAGAEALQIFESWAGVASGSLFDDFVIGPTQKIVTTLKQEFPHIPLIGFPRGAGNRAAIYAHKTGIDVLGIDYASDLFVARKMTGDQYPLQGNIDPLALLAGGSALDRAVQESRRAMEGHPYILNLGHGILPTTPIAHVEQFLSHARKEI